ncbi:hypothetical protein PSTT_07071 [Puccinia striiformis]|uniref:Uncharacterized protein n=1 Tax=Puccinia striiformis TaxID=27350 RepID=A0A2S4VI29_9BASI|nr:hypothetical protein PSTT_07071 [Puccinia striiformis]
MGHALSNQKKKNMEPIKWILKDKLRKAFFRDHPFEAYRPVSLVEESAQHLVNKVNRDHSNIDRLDQISCKPSPEDCIEYAERLYVNKGYNLNQAYKISVSEFRTLRFEEQIRTSFARQEAEYYSTPPNTNRAEDIQSDKKTDGHVWGRDLIKRSVEIQDKFIIESNAKSTRKSIDRSNSRSALPSKTVDDHNLQNRLIGSRVKNDPREEEQALDLEEDLFGGEEDDEEEEEILPDDEDDEQDNENENKRNELEYEEDQDSHLPLPSRNLHIAEAPLPNLPFPTPSDGKHWDLRIPNFLSFNPLPFTDEEFLNEESNESNENDGTRLLTDQNSIRWRWQKDKEGNPVKQSNARVISWEDGSQSLQVGTELFDMISTIDGRQNSSNQVSSQGLTYLFAQHSDLKLLEAQASITGQISLRPYSLNSLTHRIIVANRSLLKANSQRQTSLKVCTDDPEKEKIDKEAEEERKLKDLKKLDAKLARQQNSSKYSNNLIDGPGSRIPVGVRKRRFNAPLLSDEGEFDQPDEEEEEEEEEEDQYEEEMEEEEDGQDPRTVDHGSTQLTELELADQKLEEHESLNRKKKSNR